MNLEKRKENRTPEEQFGETETIELYGGKVEIIDVSPEQLKSEIPVVVSHGWAAHTEDFKENILGIAGDGRRVIAVHSPYGIEHGLKEEFEAVLPDAELRKVAALINTLEMKDIDKADIVAHSEAALTAAVTAYIYPNRFRNLVLVNPAGLMGKDNPARLMVGFSAEVVRQTIEDIKQNRLQRPVFKTFMDVMAHIGGSPIRSMREIFAISNSDTESLLRELKERGTGVSIIQSDRDMVFPADKMQKTLSGDNISGLYSVKGRHNDVYLKADEYNPVIIDALDGMEKVSNKNETRGI